MGKLEEAIKEFITSFGGNLPKENFAILYAPERCFLGLVDKDGKIEVKDNIDQFNLEKIYEARVFNADKEFRWQEGKPPAILSEANLREVDKFVSAIPQKYLLWGKRSPTNDAKNPGWTEFAEARIGKFYVPVNLPNGQEYAQFTAREYLKEFADGNVAVFEERLVGIEPYPSNNQGGMENADK